MVCVVHFGIHLLRKTRDIIIRDAIGGIALLDLTVQLMIESCLVDSVNTVDIVSINNTAKNRSSH
jgi:hypothetical protein